MVAPVTATISFLAFRPETSMNTRCAMGRETGEKDAEGNNTSVQRITRPLKNDTTGLIHETARCRLNKSCWRIRKTVLKECGIQEVNRTRRERELYSTGTRYFDGRPY